MVLQPGKCSFVLILEYCSQVEIKLLTTTCPAGSQMQMRLLHLFFFLHHVLTALVLCLLFTRSSAAAHYVVKSTNEISLNSIFAPYGFAEAVAPLKQSAVPSGHCGFCPSPVCPPPPFAFTYCRSMPPQLENSLAKHPEGVSALDGGRLREHPLALFSLRWPQF